MRNVLCCTGWVSLLPTMAPSFTDHSRGSPSHPLRSLPLNSSMKPSRLSSAVRVFGNSAGRASGSAISARTNRNRCLDIFGYMDFLLFGTDVEELWDLLEVLNQGADHVLGRYASPWRRPAAAIALLTGEKVILDESEAWDWLRNPLPANRKNVLFDQIRSDLGVKPGSFFTDRP